MLVEEKSNPFSRVNFVGVFCTPASSSYYYPQIGKIHLFRQRMHLRFFFIGLQGDFFL